MLEALIVMTITVFLLIWILAVGFVYYQHYTQVAITNDAASKIAATYNNPSSDLIMGYMEADKLADRDLYRAFANSSLKDVNEKKVKNYISHYMNMMNFGGVIKKLDVKLDLVQDSSFRKHVVVTTSCTYNTPFGEIFEAFGTEGNITFIAEGRADCTDVMDYISTVNFGARLTSGSDLNSDIIKFINSLIKVYNHKYN